MHPMSGITTMPTDEQVLEEVVTAFERIPELRSSRLYVDVQSRIVTIRGRVQSIALREQIERMLRDIVGMRALVLEVSASVSSTVRASPLPA
jgi:osmotically-inducible protein OsmY